MTTTVLKIIAIVSMAADHIGYVLFPRAQWLRVVGRLAFPIFAFLIANGYRRTHSVWKYILRLGLFAVISEIPSNLAFFGKVYYKDYHNIFFTLLLGLVCIAVTDVIKNKLIFKKIKDENTSLGMFLSVIAGAVPLALAMCAADFFKTDYAWCGVLAIFLFYLAGEDTRSAAFAAVIAALAIGYKYGQANFCGALSALAILAYNGKPGMPVFGKGKKVGYYASKYAFYAFYPAHLLVLYFISAS